MNFAALPVTFGIGVDYAIGLCSLTTRLTYLALLRSHNGAIRSLGTISAVGEITCLLAAVVVLPALYAARRVW